MGETVIYNETAQFSSCLKLKLNSVLDPGTQAHTVEGRFSRSA